MEYSVDRVDDLRCNKFSALSHGPDTKVIVTVYLLPIGSRRGCSTIVFRVRALHRSSACLSAKSQCRNDVDKSLLLALELLTDSFAVICWLLRVGLLVGFNFVDQSLNTSGTGIARHQRVPVL